MISITLISDLHGYKPKLEGGDLLIIAGDLTASNAYSQYSDIFDWIEEQNYRKKIVVAGNHDMFIEEENYKGPQGKQFDYLCDSGIEFEGFKIWGSPWQKQFVGQNPNCTAFSLPLESQLEEKWNLIPDETDILITHCPPYGILDEDGFKGERCGSDTLLHRVKQIKPYLHVFGHIHHSYGMKKKRWFKPMKEMVDSVVYHSPVTTFVNAAQMDERYRAINKPIRIELKNDDEPRHS